MLNTVVVEAITDELFSRQVILLVGITVAAILCLTQAAQLKSNSNRAGKEPILTFVSVLNLLYRIYGPFAPHPNLSVCIQELPSGLAVRKRI